MMNYPGRNVSKDSYDFQDAIRQWTYVPFNGIATHSTDLLKLSDTALKEMVSFFERDRYSVAGWREGLGMSADLQGKDVLDFGCGSGIEGLQCAKLGARVTAADISTLNLALTARLFLISEIPSTNWRVIRVKESQPFFTLPENSIDLFIASGVLHHIPYAGAIMQRVAECVRVGGDARLLLYSDKSFHAHSDWESFVKTMDPVGNYATYYDADKVEQDFCAGGKWSLEEFTYSDFFGYAFVKLERK